MRKILVISFNTGILSIVILCLYFNLREYLISPILIVLSLTLLCGYITSLFFDQPFFRLVRSFTLFFVITYTLTEFATWTALSVGLLRPDIRFFFGGFEAMNRPSVAYDTIRGYSPIPGEKRYVSISNGEAEIDHKVYANKNGWYSHHDYAYKKGNRHVRRFLLLGDSFSSGIVTETTWADQVQQILHQSGNDSIEIYNFSVDGSGIQNWYNIFFRELVPDYEFDGIIVAPSSEADGKPDFDRNFIMAQYDHGKTYMTFQDLTSQPPPAIFPFARAVVTSTMCSDSEMDQIKIRYASHHYTSRFRSQPADLHFLSILCGVTDGVYKFFQFSGNIDAYQRSTEPYLRLANKPYQMEYFDHQYKYGFMLKDILRYCLAHDKKIILAAIPDLEHSLDYIKGTPCIYRNELRFLSEYYGAAYFDGYTIFDQKNKSFIQSCFYKYDHHWNDKGVKLFAAKIACSDIFSDEINHHQNR